MKSRSRRTTNDFSHFNEPDYDIIFKFNQSFWNKIHPKQGEAIKNKYGIQGNRVDPNKVHLPAAKPKEMPSRPPAPKVNVVSPAKTEAKTKMPPRPQGEPRKMKEKPNELR